MTPCIALDTILQHIAAHHGAVVPTPSSPAAIADTATQAAAVAASTPLELLLPTEEELMGLCTDLGGAIASVHYTSCLAMQQARTPAAEPAAAASKASPAPLVNSQVQITRKTVQYDRVAQALRQLVKDAAGDATSLGVAETCASDIESLGEELISTAGQCFIMGDLWPASILLRRRNTRPSIAAGGSADTRPSIAAGGSADTRPSIAAGGSADTWELALIDWEFSHWGLPGQDLGHLLAHMLIWGHATTFSEESTRADDTASALCGSLAAGLAKRSLHAWTGKVRELAEAHPAVCAGQFLSKACLRVLFMHASAEVLARCIGAFVDGYVYEGFASDSKPVREAVLIAVSLWALAKNLDTPEHAVPIDSSFLGRRLLAGPLAAFLQLDAITNK
jgi:hypothetical protein